MKRTIIFSILLLTVVATSRAQQVKILPIDLFSDANIINPVVIDSVLYFSSNKKIASLSTISTVTNRDYISSTT